MSTLTSSSYNLTFGDLVVAKVQAHNQYGWGIQSIPNSVGALIQTPPNQMQAPTRGSATSETQIEVFWLALTGNSTGGAPIDSYNIQFDNNTNGTTWTDLAGETGFFDTSLSYLLSSYI